MNQIFDILNSIISSIRCYRFEIMVSWDPIIFPDSHQLPIPNFPTASLVNDPDSLLYTPPGITGVVTYGSLQTVFIGEILSF